ncbi:hypothetical protein OsI_19279 [Oryza sativa Indica Group]|uniref:Uncharacterized protein n=1 Tax=Oryza sativa subsp. indica TaxID=39946 RepID=A2Y2P6_ORYSI|nr:hypothetical protein OsI_19279 [Oryza sativa Indica Group]
MGATIGQATEAKTKMPPTLSFLGSGWDEAATNEGIGSGGRRWMLPPLHALGNASDRGCAWRERRNRHGSHGWLAGFGCPSLASKGGSLASRIAWPFK